jgi:DNA-directed RNA polymerase specialized sigma24 family protein
MVVDANDREVIEACQRGDYDAFRQLFEAYKDRVYSIALRFTADEAAAMDIAQETFLKLLSSIRGEQLSGPATAKPQAVALRRRSSQCAERSRRERVA